MMLKYVHLFALGVVFAAVPSFGQDEDARSPAGKPTVDTSAEVSAEILWQFDTGG